MNIPSRVIEKIARQWSLDTKTGCKNWTGACMPNGRPVINFDGKVKLVYRLTWEMENGPIPKCIHVCHHCDNPKCINVDHLFLGTDKDNIDDMIRKKRHRYGVNHPNSKLSETQVLSIFYDTRAQRVIAKEHGVCQMTVSDIKRGKKWKLLPKGVN